MSRNPQRTERGHVFAEDEKTIEDWVRDHESRLLAIAAGYADELHAAEDILQKVWMAAVRRHQQLRDPATARTWLTRITLNECVRIARKRSRRQQLMETWASEAEPCITGARLTLSEGIRNARLWKAVAELPELQRRVFRLRIQEDLSTRGVARKIGCSEGTVKTCLHRARATLRRRLGQT